MSSINISITEDVYLTLKGLKREDQSFSDIIRILARRGGISGCYGILKDRASELEAVENEADKARRQRWKGVRI